jgi:putative transposase
MIVGLAGTIGLFKTELIRRRGFGRGINDVEFAPLKLIGFYNHRRLHSACGDIPPAEFEAAHHHRHRQQVLTPLD